MSTPTFTALTPAPPRISHSSRQGSPEHTPPSSRMNEHEGKASNLAPGLDDADTNRQHTPRPPGLERKMLAGIPEALPSTEEMRPSAIIATAIPGSDRVHILSARCARACILVAKVSFYTSKILHFILNLSAGSYPLAYLYATEWSTTPRRSGDGTWSRYPRRYAR